MPPIPDSVFQALKIGAYRIPIITGYNRLEAVPRSLDVARSLRAEVRDAQFMLTRQWAFGEFEGEDAGSPVTAKILGNHESFREVNYPGGSRSPLDAALPLEAQVERETLQPSLFLAGQMGRYFLRLMKDGGLLATHRARLLAKYPLTYTVDKNDLDGQQLSLAVTGELVDGFKLHVDIVEPTGGVSRFDQWMGGEGIAQAEQDKLRAVCVQFENWFRRTYSQPAVAEQTAWLPSLLEYQFGLGTQGSRQRLTVDQYCEGHLDWYGFDLRSQRVVPAGRGTVQPAPVVSAENLVSFIPTPVLFKGMPNPRFWAMEDAQTDFGTIDTTTTGLLHLLIAEFGLVYGNDWFMLPYPMNVNTLAEIRGITVTDVFGQHMFIRPAGRGKEDDWQRWIMFHHTKSDANDQSNYYYLPPTLTKVLEGEPIESVSFIRDEMANLVWAVEGTVPSQAGKGVSGHEIARVDTPPPPFAPFNDSVRLRYVAGTTVPDNWIPFIPTRMAGSTREIRLQRARMPGAKGAMGIVLTEKKPPYYVNEEEVPRAGITVKRAFQRARWLNGKTYLWVGRYKEPGKGEGWSNLKFDQVNDIPENFK